MERSALASEVVGYFVKALREHPESETAKYLLSRGIDIDGHFGLLTADSLREAKAGLRLRGKSFREEDFEALALTEEYARQGYNCVIPLISCGQVTGFSLRNVNKNCSKENRYRYCQDAGRRGYCDRLKRGERAYLVEGFFDAVMLMQAGASNVIGIGGAKVTDDIIRLIHSYGIERITYIPDLEYNEQGKKKTAIIKENIKALQAANVEGENVGFVVEIAELPLPDGVNLENYKMDAADFGKQSRERLVSFLNDSHQTAWGWELQDLIQWAEGLEEVQTAEFQRRFDDIYKRANTYEMQQIRDVVDNYDFLRQNGITSQSLTERDKRQRQSEFKDRVRDAISDFNAAFNDGASPTRIGEIASAIALKAQELNTAEKGGFLTAEDACGQLLQRRAMIDAGWEGWKTGFNFIDVRGGLQPSHMSVIAAYSSHGKSAFALQMAKQLAERGTNVCYFSFEMDAAELMSRLVSQYTKINCNRVHTGKLTDEECNRMAEAVEEIGKLPLFLDCDSFNTCETIAAKMRAFTEKKGEGVHIIDHLNIIPKPGRETSYEFLSACAQKFKAEAQNLGVSVVLLCQFSRDKEGRGEAAEPNISMLRGSGQVAEAANEAWTIWRPEIRGGAYTGELEGEPTEGTAQIHVEKWRGAKSGDRLLFSFVGERCEFEEMEKRNTKEEEVTMHRQF